MLRKTALTFGVLAFSACSYDFPKYRAEYYTWLKELDKSVTIDPSRLPGIWQKTETVYLYRDGIKPEFDGANTHKYIDEHNDPISGELLFIYEGMLSTVHLRTVCPFREDQPTWLFDLAFGKKDAPKPADAKIEPSDLLAQALSQKPDAWVGFDIDGRDLKTQTKLRLEKDAAGNKKFEHEKQEPRLLKADETTLQIFFEKQDVQTGVHVVIDIFRRLDAESLKKLLVKSRDSKPCDNNAPPPPTTPTNPNGPNMQAPTPPGSATR